MCLTSLPGIFKPHLSLVIFSQGSSLGQFFKQYLVPIKLNEVQVSMHSLFNDSLISVLHKLEWRVITVCCWKVDWKSMDLSYLLEVGCFICVCVCMPLSEGSCGFWILFCSFQDKYIKHFADIVRQAKPVYGADLVLKAYNIDGDVRIKYKDQFDFENIAGQFGIFQEWKVIYFSTYLIRQYHEYNDWFLFTVVFHRLD